MTETKQRCTKVQGQYSSASIKPRLQFHCCSFGYPTETDLECSTPVYTGLSVADLLERTRRQNLRKVMFLKKLIVLTIKGIWNPQQEIVSSAVKIPCEDFDGPWPDKPENLECIPSFRPNLRLHILHSLDP